MRFPAAVLLTCLAAVSVPAHAQSPRHLFLDPGFLVESEGVSLCVQAPQPREFVIHADRPWEKLMISLFLTVVDEGPKIRMWYICRDADNRPNVAYAESADGVHWEKPNLGIVDYHGSKENNLVGLTSLEGVVFRDPRGTPEQRYLYVTNLAGRGIVRFFSPDGLHWQRDAKALLPFRADTQNVALFDPNLDRYVLYLRGWDVRDRWEDRLRKVVRLDAERLDQPIPIEPSGNGDDPHHPNLPRIDDEIPTVLRADEHDPANSDVYNISAQLYPPDPRWYVGFPSFLLREKHVSDGRLEVQFVGSRDGIHWNRYDRATYVSPGLAGSETANMAFLGTGLVVRGPEIWQYGVCLHSRHGDWASRRQKTDGVIRRYVQRLDGFVAATFDVSGGRCRTAPVRIDGPRMLVNLDTGALGTLRVGLLDADGKPIPGFALDQCQPLRTNATAAEVTWPAAGDLATLVGRKVQVVFAGDRAKLYGFTFPTTP